jgi:hypothetical protein
MRNKEQENTVMRKFRFGMAGVVLTMMAGAQVQERTILPVAAAWSLSGQVVGAPVNDGKGNLFLVLSSTSCPPPENSCGSGILELSPLQAPNAPNSNWGLNDVGTLTYGAYSGGLLHLQNGHFYITVSGGTNGTGYVMEAVPPNASGLQWRFKQIYNFQAQADASFPTSKLAADSAGNLYAASNTGVFQLKPPANPGAAWMENLISTSAGNGITVDGAGNVFVTAIGGGPGDSIFELLPPASTGGAWTQRTLYTFPTGTATRPARVGHPGSTAPPPKGPVIYGNLEVDPVFDGSGNLYATDTLCTASGFGCVFELTPTSSGHWIFSDLFDFTGDSNLYTPGATGGYPTSGVLLRNGKLYGTTNQGGVVANSYTFGSLGTVYELDPPKSVGGSWTEKVLHAFTAGFDGAYPNTALLEHGGAFYGATVASGDGSATGFYALYGIGTVYQLVP